MPRSQMIHIWEDLTHKMDRQPPKKEVSWVRGIYSWVNAPKPYCKCFFLKLPGFLFLTKKSPKHLGT